MHYQVHSQLQKWNKKKAELKEQTKEEQEAGQDDSDDDDSNNSNSVAAYHRFADLNIMACILCQRKFKSLQDLQRHQELSELHKVQK